MFRQSAVDTIKGASNVSSLGSCQKVISQRDKEVDERTNRRLKRVFVVMLHNIQLSTRSLVLWTRLKALSRAFDSSASLRRRESSSPSTSSWATSSKKVDPFLYPRPTSVSSAAALNWATPASLRSVES